MREGKERGLVELHIIIGLLVLLTWHLADCGHNYKTTEVAYLVAVEEINSLASCSTIAD